MKLITKLGQDVVAKEKITSANDVFGSKIKQLKVYQIIEKKKTFVRLGEF